MLTLRRWNRRHGSFRRSGIPYIEWRYHNSTISHAWASPGNSPSNRTHIGWTHCTTLLQPEISDRIINLGAWTGNCSDLRKKAGLRERSTQKLKRKSARDRLGLRKKCGLQKWSMRVNSHLCGWLEKNWPTKTLIALAYENVDRPLPAFLTKKLNPSPDISTKMNITWEIHHK